MHQSTPGPSLQDPLCLSSVWSPLKNVSNQLSFVVAVFRQRKGRSSTGRSGEMRMSRKKKRTGGQLIPPGDRSVELRLVARPPLKHVALMSFSL